MLKQTLSLTALAAAMTLISLPASAQAQQSTYTRIDACPSFEHEDDTLWEVACLGHAGWNVFMFSREHGSAIAYNKDGGLRSDAFNPPQRGPFGMFNDVIEWRNFDDSAPHATIHRYTHVTPTEYNPDTGETSTTEVQILMVTALQSDSNAIACPVAYINASNIRNANQVAREVADGFAPDFDCDTYTPYSFESYDDYEDAVNNMNDHL